jgi:hypothetical protein
VGNAATLMITQVSSVDTLVGTFMGTVTLIGTLGGYTGGFTTDGNIGEHHRRYTSGYCWMSDTCHKYT